MNSKERKKKTRETVFYIANVVSKMLWKPLRKQELKISSMKKVDLWRYLNKQNKQTVVKRNIISIYRREIRKTVTHDRVIWDEDGKRNILWCPSLHTELVWSTSLIYCHFFTCFSFRFYDVWVCMHNVIKKLCSDGKSVCSLIRNKTNTFLLLIALTLFLLTFHLLSNSLNTQELFVSRNMSSWSLLYTCITSLFDVLSMMLSWCIKIQKKNKSFLRGVI